MGVSDLSDYQRGFEDALTLLEKGVPLKRLRAAISERRTERVLAYLGLDG